eukprot:Amastigsp_a508691_358.p4 type:complete len:165 gc:universal Amastigsp_a508691_358:1065-1559(+)
MGRRGCGARTRHRHLDLRRRRAEFLSHQAHTRDASDVFPHQQVHSRVPEHRRRVRRSQLRRGQPWRVRHCHVPFPLRSHVRRYRPRNSALHLRVPPLLQREGDRQAPCARDVLDHFQRSLPDPRHGPLCDLLRLYLQRLLCARGQRLRIQLRRAGGRQGHCHGH